MSMEAALGAMTPPVTGTRSALVCTHDGFHSVTTRYDRQRGVLICLWKCDRCGQLIGELRRLSYRPRFDPGGSDRLMRQPG